MVLTIDQVRDIARQVHGGSESVILDDECIGEFNFKVVRGIIESIEITYVRAKVVDGDFKFWPIQPVKEIVPPEKHQEYIEKFKKYGLPNT